MPKKSITNSVLDSNKKNFAEREEKIREVRKYGIEAKGQALFIKNLMGERLTANQAGIAYCYDCMGWYADGKEDCKEILCPLYARMPYGVIVRAHRHLPAKRSDAPVSAYDVRQRFRGAK